MNPMLVLTGLLAVAYFGSMLVGGRAVRGYGLPSGTEFLLLGVILGPHFFGVVGRAMLSGFEGLTVFGLAWLTLVAGAQWGERQDRRVPLSRMLFGLGLTSGCALATGLAAAAAAALCTDMDRSELGLLAIGAAAVSSETTRHVVGWVVERYSATGPLADLLEEVAEADDGVPILLVAVFAAFAPAGTGFSIDWPAWSALLATFGIGGAMGATCAALFDIEPRESQRWGIVLGTALLAVGASLRLGLGAIAATFLLGFVSSRLARMRRVLQIMLRRTERAVMLPALILAGAFTHAPDVAVLGPITVAVILARGITKWLASRELLRVAGVEDPGGARLLAQGMMSAGALSVTAGFACSLRAPGRVGDIVLQLAVACAVVGELIGPYSLRRSLERSGGIALAKPVEPA